MKFGVHVFILSTMIWTANGQQEACPTNSMHEVANGACRVFGRIGCKDAPDASTEDLEECAALEDLYFSMTEGGVERRFLRAPRELTPKDIWMCDDLSGQATGTQLQAYFTMGCCKAYFRCPYDKKHVRSSQKIP
jgi:hypothetical protein